MPPLASLRVRPFARAILAMLLLAACGGTEAKRQADAPPTNTDAPPAPSGAPGGSALADAAPSVVPVTARDSANPELDSLVRAAHAAGIPDAMLPPGARTTDAAAPADGATSPATQAPPAPNAAGGASLVPLASGLRVASTLAFPDGDRENVVTADVSDAGVTYAWHLRQQAPGGKAREYTLKRFVRAADLAGAPRRNDIVGTEGAEETPGYTFVTISRATYQQLRSGSPVRYTVTEMEQGLLGDAMGGIGASRVTYKGTLALVSSSPVPLPVLLDGRRTTLPALHLKGDFAFQEKRLGSEWWVLADSLHPLILKEVNGDNVLQVVRIDRPAVPDAVEASLAKDCRAELPGIYFAFGSAALDPASAPALALLAAMLGRHADWSLAIEGHTDNVGSAAANQALSQQRAEAVRTALASRLSGGAARLTATGFGATRPREPNTTLEGRARNRRVEVVRPCAS